MIIAIALNDDFADNGPNIKPRRFADLFPPIDVPLPDKKFDLGRAWFKAELDKNLNRRRLIAHGGIDIPLKPIEELESANNGDLQS